MPRNACVIQITPVRLTRTSANDASVVRKIYLSIDPIVTARSPPRDLDPRLATNPEIGIPFGRAAIPPAGSVSHYHPFDPSTKWLRHGALRIWLIIHAMWPRSHCPRLAAQAVAGHSAPTMLLTDVNRTRREHSEYRPAGSRPATALAFWRICLCPTPSRSASFRFPPPRAAFWWSFATIR